MQNQNDDINYLEAQIEKAKKTGKPIDKYILLEIDWLKRELNKFIETQKKQGKDIENDFDIAEIEVRQYAVMKQLAEQINKPTTEYEEAIIKNKKRIFGDENYENFFGKKD